MIRAFLSGMRIHLVQFTRNPFDVTGVVLWPILYASIAYYLLDAKDDPELLLSASLGAAVMLMWSLVVIGSAGALEQQRWLGRSSCSSPRPCRSRRDRADHGRERRGRRVLARRHARLGHAPLRRPARDRAAARVRRRRPRVRPRHRDARADHGATFVLYRAAFHLGIAMQYPVWIATGLLVPLSVLPGFVGKISWFLAPTWGFRAIQESALGGSLGRTSACASSSAPATSSSAPSACGSSSTSRGPARRSGSHELAPRASSSAA